MVIDTWGPEETRAFGKKMGQEARPGQVICLNGDLGVGKTIFTQGFAEGLGIDEPVNSPTFTIVQQYDTGDCRFIILTYTVSVISAKWTRSDTKTVSTETAFLSSNGPS